MSENEKGKSLSLPGIGKVIINSIAINDEDNEIIDIDFSYDGVIDDNVTKVVEDAVRSAIEKINF